MRCAYSAAVYTFFRVYAQKTIKYYYYTSATGVVSGTLFKQRTRNVFSGLWNVKHFTVKICETQLSLLSKDMNDAIMISCITRELPGVALVNISNG